MSRRANERMSVRVNEPTNETTDETTNKPTNEPTNETTDESLFFSKICSICLLCVSLQLTVLLDTAVVPEELKPYLSLYLEVIFESPLLRDGGMMCSLNPSTNISFSLRFFENTNYL